MTEPAALVLEDGRIHRGSAFGAVGVTFGEAVFSTGMTGYQETLTDPSYRRQVVVATAPQIGNTGWVDADDESDRIWVAGYVIRDSSPAPSSWRATGSLPEVLAAQGIVGIKDVDTRGLTRHLRSAGVMRCGIFSGADIGTDDEMVQRVRQTQQMTGADLAGEVTTGSGYTVEPDSEHRFTVAAVDLGIKANTPRHFAARGVRTHVLPAGATIDDVFALDGGAGAQGIFLSNGPGDPATADGQVALAREALRRRIPLFGICFGNQILGRALGFGTYKLTFGHRGINQPVVDLRSGRVLITAQNHGFAVDVPAATGNEPVETEFGRARVAFRCLNDDVIEGLECLDAPAFSVQFHPEAAAGPHDAGYLFDDFLRMMDAAAH